jgi:hypothetical protein
MNWACKITIVVNWDITLVQRHELYSYLIVSKYFVALIKSDTIMATACVYLLFDFVIHIVSFSLHTKFFSVMFVSHPKKLNPVEANI